MEHREGGPGMWVGGGARGLGRRERRKLYVLFQSSYFKKYSKHKAELLPGFPLLFLGGIYVEEMTLK